MHGSFRVVCCTPAGRRKHMELLVPLILKLRPHVDEHQLWVNTTNPEDVEYIEHLERAHAGFIKAVRLQPSRVINRRNLKETISAFYAGCCDPDAVYVRVDDDVVALDDVQQFVRFLEYRVRCRPDVFLLSANVVNTCLMTYLHQRHGIVPTVRGGPVASWNHMDTCGRQDSSVARGVHDEVLRRGLAGFRILPETYLLLQDERMHLSFVSWFGSDFRAFQGDVPSDDCLFRNRPRELGKRNAVYLQFVAVHYAYSPQRPVLDQHGYLDKYAKLGEQALPLVAATVQLPPTVAAVEPPVCLAGPIEPPAPAEPAAVAAVEPPACATGPTEPPAPAEPVAVEPPACAAVVAQPPAPADPVVVAVVEPPAPADPVVEPQAPPVSEPPAPADPVVEPQAPPVSEPPAPAEPQAGAVEDQHLQPPPAAQPRRSAIAARSRIHAKNTIRTSGSKNL